MWCGCGVFGCMDSRDTTSLASLQFAAAGLVLNWNQTNGVLHASGDVRVIRLWDTHKEMRILVGIAMCFRVN